MIPVAQLKKDLAYSEDLTDVIDSLKTIASAEFKFLTAKA